jgi:hypothetical protein
MFLRSQSTVTFRQVVFPLIEVSPTKSRATKQNKTNDFGAATLTLTLWTINAQSSCFGKNNYGGKTLASDRKFFSHSFWMKKIQNSVWVERFCLRYFTSHLGK